MYVILNHVLFVALMNKIILFLAMMSINKYPSFKKGDNILLLDKYISIGYIVEKSEEEKDFFWIRRQ